MYFKMHNFNFKIRRVKTRLYPGETLEVEHTPCLGNLIVSNVGDVRHGLYIS